MHLYKHSLMHK